MTSKNATKHIRANLRALARRAKEWGDDASSLGRWREAGEWYETQLLIESFADAPQLAMQLRAFGPR